MRLNKNFFLKTLIIVIYTSLTLSSTIKRQKFKDLIDQYLNQLDINNAYLSYEQYINLLNTLIKDFPNYLELSSIGKTYEGNDMPLLIMKSPFDNDNNNLNNSLYNKTGILFDGMHHGREPVSMMMNIYLILHLLSLPRTYLHLFLSSTNIYFIPIINIDTYKYNSERYLKGEGISKIMARKNRRHHTTKNCKPNDIGVDLNRNYDCYFAKDNDGSSGNPCEEDYRGEYPFSEPETQNMKKFVDDHPDIKIVYNYHSWGNLIITPFNYLKHEESEKKIKEEFPLQYEMYLDFMKEANYPVNFLFGNADKTIKYKTNGDATDWFLGKKKILSFSPELGNGNKNSDVFYPNRQITFDVLEKNLYAGIYAIQKSMYFLKGELITAYYNKCSKQKIFNPFTNRGKLYQDNNNDINGDKYCSSDEVILNIKTKIINRGFGDYIPGVEFPSFTQANDYRNGTIEVNENKKYFYFLALDLKVDLNNIVSMCYWNTLQISHKVEEDIGGNSKEKKSETEEKEYIGKIRCSNINKGNDINDMKIFIDGDIKSLEYVILNIQIVAKKDNFITKLNKKKNQKSDNPINSVNNNEFIKIFTKNDRLIKSETSKGETIKWLFNNPTIDIKIEDFIEKKENNLFNNKNIMNLYQIAFIIVGIGFILLFFGQKIIKLFRRRPSHRLLVESVNRNNNNEMSYNNGDFGMNNEQIVNNLENVNQNNNVNNEHIIPVQIPKDDNEFHNNNNPNTNSNSESPTELNAT